jgi:hypothetical protein
MRDDAQVRNVEHGTARTMQDWYATEDAQYRYRKFALAAVRATFASAGFTQIPEARCPWDGKLPGTSWPCIFFERNGVRVAAHPLSYEVFAPGDGVAVTSFPDAQLAIRFVQAFEQDTELMAADELSDEQLTRAQALAHPLMVQALRDAERDLAWVRMWMGLEALNGAAGPASGSDA